MSGGFLAVSFYKDSDGTTYQLDGANISPDSTGYSAERILDASTKGTERKKNVKHTFEIRHNDSSFHSNLEGDSDYGNVSWNMVAAGLDRFILWYEDSEINVVSEKAESDPEGDPFPYVIRMISYGSAIGTGVNLLHAYARTQGYTTAWGDSDSDNEADIINTLGLTSATFSTNEQGGNTTGSTYEAITKMKFPITGITITFNLFHSLIAATNDVLTIQQRDFSGSQIGSESEDKSGDSTSVSELTLSSIYNLWVIYCQSSGSGEAVSFSNPSVRLNGSTEYIDG
jgi:hypothetical protein